jgi:FkbM family methyltransferase
MIADLIYDVGLHKGEDAAFYLKKGFQVVGIEANPDLVQHCQQRFPDETASGQLKIIKGAIAPASEGPTITFYRNTDSVLSTINKTRAERAEKLGHKSETIVLPRIDIGDVYRSHGIPYFLKVDVEGADQLVLEGLKDQPSRPQYLSAESDKVDFDELEGQLALLRELGYRKFKAVQQQEIPGSLIQTRSLDGTNIEHVFESGASGPFGDDLGGAWLDYDGIIRRYRSIFRDYRFFGDDSVLAKFPIFALPFKAVYKICTGQRGSLPGWYDTHAGL